MQRTLVYVDTKYRRFAHTYSGGPIKQRRPHVQSTHMNHHVKGDAGTFICLGERVLDFAVLQSSTWSNRLGNMPAIWPHAYFIALGPRLKGCKRSMLPPHCIMGLVLKGKPKKMLLPCAFVKFFFLSGLFHWGHQEHYAKKKNHVDAGRMGAGVCGFVTGRRSDPKVSTGDTDVFAFSSVSVRRINPVGARISCIAGEFSFWPYQSCFIFSTTIDPSLLFSLPMICFCVHLSGRT